jgi:Asp-tRNA(Asn)/Glu-tRNA(Gln) amidotransferase C subunit
MPGTLNKLQELMVLTMEECGELTQRCSKIIRKFETLEEVTEEQRVLTTRRSW